MSVLAIVFAGTGVLLTFLPGARNVSNGELGRRALRFGAVLYYLVRLTFTLTRAVPDLIWAMIIISFWRGGVLPGAVPWACTTTASWASCPPRWWRTLTPARAGPCSPPGPATSRMLMYGILPQALPQFLTYLLYRWEVVIRTTVVIGFVSVGGLGREFRLSMSFFHYTEVALIVLWYLILVISVDLVSAWLRRVARSG